MIAFALVVLAVVTIAAVVTNEKPAQAANTPEEWADRKRARLRSGCGWAALLLVGLVFVFGVALGPIGPGNGHPAESSAMQATRVLVLAMFQYASDNDGQYPDGKSSTEVFQKLMDGKYVTDPAVFFVPLPGKVVAAMGARLKPENVAFDVTSGIDANSPDTLPIVFLTGFRMDYRAGADVVSLVKPFPNFRNWPNAWFPWSWTWESFDGLPVAYKSNNAFFRVNQTGGHPARFTPDDYGIVPDVVASDFNANGQTYRQLTPDGVLK